MCGLYNYKKRQKKMDENPIIQKKHLNKPRCKKCNSTMTYIRLKTKQIVCRDCGNISKQEGKNDG